MVMNKKAFIEDINFAYVGLSLLAGMIAYYAASRVPDVSKVIPILSGIFTIAVCYAYLSFTGE